ncbi:hypothetical protein VTI74DRAFT_10980 [Chaetomium olivicolor]
MAQAPAADPSRERAVSSEPCSTRPNPFDDSDLTSRKRRRTSLTSEPRSRSAETSSPSPKLSPTGRSAPQLRTDSAMKIDSDPAVPTTPDRQDPDNDPSSDPRSIPVPINVRRSQKTMPSSPPSSSAQATSPPSTSPTDDVKASMEEPEAAIVTDNTVDDIVLSSDSESGSPPIEIISVSADDDAEYEEDDEPITMLDESGRAMVYDPTLTFPFHETPEPYMETVVRLFQYFPTHEQVSRTFMEWIEKFLDYACTASPATIHEYYFRDPEMWQSIPSLVFSMVSRGRNSYARSRDILHQIFGFFRSFARLTAFWVEFDVRTLENPSFSEQPHVLNLASPLYLQALCALTRREEVSLHLPLRIGNEDWNYSSEMTAMLNAFQVFVGVPGGSLTHLEQLATAELAFVSQFPRLVSEHLGSICLMAGNLLKLHFRRQHYASPQLAERAKQTIARFYSLFSTVSATLSAMFDRNLNQLSSDGAASLIEGLTEIYETCLSTSDIVPQSTINEHLTGHPLIAQHHVPEAVAHHWKFSQFARLIKSGQMQLRVMAVSNMCSDLVAFYGKFDPPGDAPGVAMLQYLSDILVSTGLVNYILGPTCHPEITLESSNIIGFLVASKTYTHAHTDTLWQTVTSTLNPRVSDALIRMTSRITGLFSADDLLYFFEKLNTVPVEAFGSTMRDFCDLVFKQVLTKYPESLSTNFAPFELCIRLIRQSSGLASQSPVAYPDLQQFAVQKLDTILTYGPGPEGRWNIYRDSIADIAQRPTSAIGSLWVLGMTLRGRHLLADLRVLASDHDLIRLLIEELESAILSARAAGFPAVISGPRNTPRRDLLQSVISHEPRSITKALGPKLWNLLVGSGAACQEDRDVAWKILTAAMRENQGKNPFTSICFAHYLHTLDPKFFCQGALHFVREGVIPLVATPTSIVLDDDTNPNYAGIELLWRMSLSAPTGTVEKQAIQTLVNDVYIRSKTIQSCSHHRARKIHLALVGRCLSQLSMAASKLRAFDDGPVDRRDESMVLVATDEQIQEQVLLFNRSLGILREFHQIYQSRPEFSPPDMRSLILEPPEDVEGEPAELKYQSFDGDRQTTVMPLNIGKRNTAASLLASLRDATGFESYRIYYRGKPFVPQESDICKSLEDLQIHNGIILVKKESEETQDRQGASLVDVEILRHFDELWEYLSMEEQLAREIYYFLVKLPANEKVIKAIDDASLSYVDMFPLGQPYKSLYAIHVLREYLGSWQLRAAGARRDGQDWETKGHSSRRSGSSLRALSLVVAAILDPMVALKCPNREVQMELSSALVELFGFLLKEPELGGSVAQFLDASLLDRLLSILSVAVSANTPQSATKHVPLCLLAIFECCSMSDVFMSAFCVHEEVAPLFGHLLLSAPQPVRRTTAHLIAQKTGTVKDSESPQKATTTTATFRSFFWPLISRLIKPAIAGPENAVDVLDLGLDMFRTLQHAQPETLDLKQLAKDWFDLLLGYTTSEDPTRPDNVDMVAAGLIRLLHMVVCPSGGSVNKGEILPERGVARRIFWKHLFQRRKDGVGDFEFTRPITCVQTRGWLLEIIFTLVKDDPTQFRWLLDDLYELAPVFSSQDGEFYAYDLPQQFEREKAIRTPFGYSGLRNLSNTCYFNSLLTQLFMNVDFRQFMLSATVRDGRFDQGLLYQTQKLFGFLQNSIRPFINPEDCVASIKTYEDAPIDVVIQMDVDEFYNLLFDRWEGQFLNNEEKNRFRSFYGGQLVQQVRSQECDHVSERFEPFSAIQCDIKGKSSLQESLLAYVDGEIMEGDNKYKCSTCDRHVDAVKRASLKDIPDNLIFHLKRFDFNLRTMQRSKINDYFSFPTRVDMRPYTFDHLNNPSEERKEDIFELVGVLVHSGTAESGHYYSYIRERPTTCDRPTWIEFNDETVSTWDPASMAASCFGGPDSQGDFPPNGVVFDKQYSAYMLFYQRSSSIARNQAMLQQPGSSVPLGVHMPEEIYEAIREENALLTRRHCLFDPSHIQFVCLALSHVRGLHSGGCSPGHAMDDCAIAMALGHLDQVASRAKDAPDFSKLLSRIKAKSEDCTRCNAAICQYFLEYPIAFRWLLQKNVDEDIRQATADLMIQVLGILRAQMPHEYGLIPFPEEDGFPEESDEEDFNNLGRAPPPKIITSMVHMIELVWSSFHIALRSWHEVFGFMLSFVKLGRQELAAFLAHPNFLKWLLWMVRADTNSEGLLPHQFVKMAALVSRRTPNRAPSYDTIIALLQKLLLNIRFRYTSIGHPTGISCAGERLKPGMDLDQPFDLTKTEAEIIHQMGPRSLPVNIFVDRLISIAQNPAATTAIISHLIRQSRSMENRIFHTLVHRITGQLAAHNVTPYLHAASRAFCLWASDAGLIRDLIKHVSQQCMNLQNPEGKAFLDFQQEVFDRPQHGSGESPRQILLAGLDNIPEWAPGLLGYFDNSIVHETEVFLQENIFDFRTYRPPSSDEPASEERELNEKMRLTARALGFKCLWYLRDMYVLRNVEVAERTVAGLQRVIKLCARYFNLREPAEDEEAASFVELSQSVLEQLTSLIVPDDLEEDGSDWENSSVCSGRMDGFADVNAAELQG